jgi:hypothetical protein
MAAGAVPILSHELFHFWDFIDASNLQANARIAELTHSPAAVISFASTDRTGQLLCQLVFAQRHCVQIFCTEFHPNPSINVKRQPTFTKLMSTRQRLANKSYTIFHENLA